MTGMTNSEIATVIENKAVKREMVVTKPNSP